MAYGSPPGESIEAEKARYRQKLADWRAMGFDVSALEVLLETDFEKFKEKRFELMRRQIHGPGGTGQAAGARPEPSHTPWSPSPPDTPARGAQPAETIPRRPGLHSHFVGQSRPAEPAATPAEAAARPERLHSEMRYPAARRRPPEREVRTFSVASDSRPRPRGISVGDGARPAAPAGAPRPKKRALPPPIAAPPAPRRRRTEPPEEESLEVEVDEAAGEPEVAVEEEDGPPERARRAARARELVVMEGEGGGEGPDDGREPGAGEEAPAGEEGPAGEAETAGGGEPDEEAHAVEEEPAEGPEPEEEAERPEEEEPPEEDGPPEEEARPSLGYFTPASRVPMKPRERPRPERAARAVLAPDAARPVVKKKLRKPAAGARPAPAGAGRSRAWAAVAVVLVVVLAGLAGLYYLAPRTAIFARAAFPASAEAGALVSFDGGNSTTTGKGIDRYDWSFGDGATGKGRRVGHYFSAADTYTVSLTVRDQDGTRSAPYRSKITISPLTATVPAKKLDDQAAYAVNGSADIRNTDTYLYRVSVAGQEVTVSEVQLNLTGTMTQWVRAQLPEEDGFGQNHSALWTTSQEDLSLSGKAITSFGQPWINGELKFTEDSFTDAASADAFQVRSRAVTNLRLLNLPSGQTSINSTDTLRAYPGVAGMTAQFQPEDIYRGRTFGQSDGQPDGTYKSGNTTYYWSRMGVRNIAGYPSLGLNMTAEKAYLDRNGFTEFYMNVWISSLASLPTATLLHVRGRSGDNTFYTDHLAEMTSFRPGTDAVNLAPQAFDPSPLPGGLFYSPFTDVIDTGAGNASLRFSPEQALQEASARDGSFRDFLTNNPQSYAVAGKYYEGQFGPGSATWNLTFSWPNATSSYWVNVTRDLLQQYTVRGGFGGGLSQVRSAESGFSRMLTLTSAEERMRSDSETFGAFFKDGSVNWAGGTSLELSADSMYPSLNLGSLYASPERAGYATILRKGTDASAFSADTGQMMYFYTHATS